MKRIRIIASILIILTLITGVALASEKVVHGDKIALFKDIRIEEGTKLDGDIIAIFSDVDIDGTVDGDVISIFGKVNLFGNLDGNIISVLGNIDMGEKSIVTRDMIQITIGDDDRPNSAIIRGEEVTMRLFESEISGISALIIFLVAFFALKNIFGFILSAILVAVIPERMDKITYATSNRIGRRLGIGILGVIVFYSALTILGAIVIGTPLIPILLILRWLLGLGGNTAVKMAIGRKVGKKGQWSRITQLLVGSLIYMLIDITIILKPILYFGKLIGMGAIIDTKIGTTEYWSKDSAKHSGNNEAPTYTVKDENDNNRSDEIQDQLSIEDNNIEDDNSTQDNDKL
ncbi:hypothetical protein [Sporosalibacterium faouarense]|uniref:hypothetical protein n=1 Tax=Sporosalibacterium faouarense TaxID=516123 RepID=UPI00141D0433|nr:hypothetical protein [Sporosalibacterium faouarense]MTI46768.1 hypothetical protein [Bacillota bacterium]